MEILLLLALLAAVYVLFQRSRGVEPASSGFGRALSGCLGLGCLATVIAFALAVVAIYFVLQWLVNIDLSVFGLDPGDAGGDGGGQGGQDSPRLSMGPS